ncbi:MAG: AAA family ATPase [Peptostreptococcus sp.]|uniref:AAA family ATPase n=1 Tax=Peptostreptococcus sp. TaxID=1262 RepID=UPI002FC82199
MYSFEEFLNKIKISYDNWDDFGHKTTAILRFYNKYERSDDESRLVHFNVYPNENYIYDSIKNGVKPEVSDFCVLGNEDYYSFINKNIITEEDKKKWYELTNDLAYDLNLLESMLEREKKLERKKRFINESFLRSVSISEVKSQYNRMTKGGAYLSKFEIPIYYRNKKEKKVIYIKIDPNDLIPENTYAIIGKNGSGKTYFLKHISKMFLDEDSDFYTEKSNLRNIDRVIYISYSPFDSTLDIENEKFYQIGLSNLGERVSFDEININKYNSISDYFNKELELALNELKNPKLYSSRELWKNIFNKFNYEDWVIEFLEKIENLDAELEKKELIGIIENLSSGQKIVLLSLTSLVLKVKEKTVVIVDEPELFLHQSMIKSYVRALIEVITKNNGICIMATHNPIVLQEVQTSCVKTICRNKNNVLLKNLPINSFGENVNMLNNVVFGLDIQNTGYYELISSMDRKTLEYEYENLIKKMGSEGKILLNNFKENFDEEN